MNSTFAAHPNQLAQGHSGDIMATAAFLILTGRVIFGLFFVIAGIRNFLHFGERKMPDTNYGWKLASPVTALGFASQLLGGVSVMFGIYPAWGAALLILFLICATSLFHNFMLFEGEERQPHLYFTLVNIALCGYGLMIIGLSH
ncbi:MAG: DoxX family membrane protein [Alphaproteobacteria bacterium]|nr:DoxX family membrane protein [Alphaproteobacteria bacterium]